MKGTLKQINDSYLLEIEGWSPKTIEIDGVRHREFKTGWLKRRPTAVKVIERKSRPVSFGDFTPEEYQTEMAKLEPVVNNDGEYIFKSLDHEFAYRKFMAEHPAAYEDYEEMSDLDLIEVNITGRTDNPLILPYRFIGEPEHKEGQVLYRYQADPYKLAQEIAKKLGLEEVGDGGWGPENTKGMKWSAPSHSRNNLEYVKVNGNYAEYKQLPTFHSITCGTYEECSKCYREHYEAIEEMFKREIRRLRAEGARYDKARVIDELKHLKNLVGEIEAKRGSTIQPHHVKVRIQQFIDNL